MRRLAKPKYARVLTGNRTHPKLTTNKRREDRLAKRTRGETSLSSRNAPDAWKRNQSPRFRLNRRQEIQDGIDKRKKAEETNKRQRIKGGLKRKRPFCEVRTREVSVKELEAEKRALDQEKRALGQELAAARQQQAKSSGVTKRAGGIPIVGPIRYPVGPLPWGKGSRAVAQEQARSSGDHTRGGLPPGLCVAHPPVEQVSKRQKAREKDPEPRISDKEFEGLKQAIELWSLLGNKEGVEHLNGDLLYDDDAMKYARQGKVFCAESQRAHNFAYANRMARDDWGQRLHFGETPSGYTPEDEFYDALVRYRQSQYDAPIKEKKKKRR